MQEECRVESEDRRTAQPSSWLSLCASSCSGKSEKRRKARGGVFANRRGSVSEQERRIFETVLDETPSQYVATTYQPDLDIVFVDARLTLSTVELAANAKAVSVSVQDHCGPGILYKLHELGVRFVANRFAGSSEEDMARSIGIEICQMSGHCIASLAEYTITMILMLEHKLSLAVDRVRSGHCSLHDMAWTELAERTVGVVGTGEVGVSVVRWLRAFDTRVICFDVTESEKVTELGAEYVTMDELLETSDVITLHCALTPATYHLINATSLRKCKKGVHIINVSRGPLVHTNAIVDALYKGQVGAFGADVLEGDTRQFLDPNSFPRDSKFEKLLSMKNVFLSIHAAQNTHSALEKVIRFVLDALKQFQLRVIIEDAATKYGHTRNPFGR